MAIKFESTPSAPKVVGPYSPAVRACDFLILSGVIGKNPSTDELASGLESQTKQVLANIEAVLGDCGASMTDVAKTTMFMTHMGDYATANKLYEEAFADHKPARSTVAVSELPAGAMIEIEVWAYLG